MALTEIIAGTLYQRTSELSGPQQPVNSYVLRAGGEAIIIDPPADFTPRELRDLPPAAHVLITHLQRENSEGAANFPGARVHVPAGDEYLAAGAEAYNSTTRVWPPPWEWETRGNYTGDVAGAPNERPPGRPLPLSDSLRPGSTFLGLEILATPGHGKNAVTLVADVAGKRVAFCGDLICADGRLWNWFDSEWDYGLQTGQRKLMNSAKRLRSLNVDLLCPTHGPTISQPAAALEALERRLAAILKPAPSAGVAAANFTHKPSPAPGFRELLPNLHQYVADSGNCNVLVSRTGGALLVDDGLCHWHPEPERSANHRRVIGQLKQALGISRIEVVLPSHYHGDHTENIPELVEMEGTEVICIDAVADPIEHPERFAICALLPWYGTAHDSIKVDRRLRDGDRLQWHEFSLQFLHLGGQTCHTQAVAVEIDGVRVLFVGDSIGGLNTECEPVMCYNGEPFKYGWKYAVERMCECRPDLIVAGHGVAIRNPMPLLEQKRAAWERRMREFADLSYRTDLDLFFNPAAR